MKTRLFLLAFIASQAVLAGSPPPPMTPTDAFNQGMTDGATGAAAVSADINSTSASTNVDAYSTTNANSSYFCKRQWRSAYPRRSTGLHLRDHHLRRSESPGGMHRHQPDCR